MNLAAILSRCRENAEKWEAQADKLYDTSPIGLLVSQLAAADWRSLEKEIGEELDRETEWFLKEKWNAPPP